jgi:uncharacterized protein (TIGR02118 family)
MVKVMILLARRPDLTHEEFEQWWLERHILIAGDLPHVRKATLNVVQDDPDGAGFDGVGELWFDSIADMQAAYASDVGRAVIADSVAHTSRRLRLVVDELPQLADAPCDDPS